MKLVTFLCYLRSYETLKSITKIIFLNIKSEARTLIAKFPNVVVKNSTRTFVVIYIWRCSDKVELGKKCLSSRCCKNEGLSEIVTDVFLS